MRCKHDLGTSLEITIWNLVHGEILVHLMDIDGGIELVADLSMKAMLVRQSEDKNQKPVNVRSLWPEQDPEQKANHDEPEEASIYQILTLVSSFLSEIGRLTRKAGARDRLFFLPFFTKFLDFGIAE